MWADFLASERDLLSPERPIELGALLELNVMHGINDSLWGPAPDTADDEDVAAPSDEAEADLAALWDDGGDDDES